MRVLQVFREPSLPRAVGIGYFGQVSSEQVVAITPKAARPTGEVQRNRRQEETFRKVLAAGVEVLRETSYADLTVRAGGAPAHGGPAAAFTHFSFQNQL